MHHSGSHQPNRTRRQFSFLRLLAIAMGFAGIAWSATGQHVPGIKYADQPTGIELPAYVATWPALKPYVVRLQASQGAAVLAELKQRALAPGVSDGELNLLAQLEWQHGELDVAETAITRAVTLQPNQPAHAFQEAMISFAHLRRASGMMDRWKWQRRTRDAYQRAFDLDPRNPSARYYLAYSYMNTPAIGGGDKDKALKLAGDGVALGQDEFYVVRADAHRLRGEHEAAVADYDRAIERRAFKLSGFLDAGADELKRQDIARAKRYYEWAVYCRADSPGAHEGLGDYYVAVGNVPAAVRSYQTALQKDPRLYSAKEKLARLDQKPR